MYFGSLRAAGQALHHLRRVAREVAAQDLVNTVWMLQRRVGGRPMIGHLAHAALKALGGVLVVLGERGRHHLALVLPGVVAVAGVIRVEAREDPAVVLGVDVAVLDNGGDVGVGEREVAEPQIVHQYVADDAAEEGDVGTRADRRVDVGQSRGAGEAWIDMDHRGATRLRLDHEAECDRMVLGHVRAHHGDAVGIGHVP
jgi:hypothetical protein